MLLDWGNPLYILTLRYWVTQVYTFFLNFGSTPRIIRGCKFDFVQYLNYRITSPLWYIVKLKYYRWFLCHSLAVGSSVPCCWLGLTTGDCGWLIGWPIAITGPRGLVGRRVARSDPKFWMCNAVMNYLKCSHNLIYL